MYISEIVEINNYRNLTGKTITFNDRSKKRNPEYGNGKADRTAEPESDNPD